jgi:cytochrome c biogenesis protein CcmG/thiol:disulfide interchange protein DsbE
MVRRRRRTALWSSVAVAILLAVLVALLATRKAATDVQAPSPLLGRAAPGISGPDLGGRQVSLAAFHGKYVLVNFFATWCVPCQQEHPDLISFESRHAAQGDVALVGVIFDPADADRVAPFFAKNGGNWPVLRDDTAKVAYGLRGVPETFLIDPGGAVITHIVGRVTDAGLETLVRTAEERNL